MPASISVLDTHVFVCHRHMFSCVVNTCFRVLSTHVFVCCQLTHVFVLHENAHCNNRSRVLQSNTYTLHWPSGVSSSLHFSSLCTRQPGELITKSFKGSGDTLKNKKFTHQTSFFSRFTLRRKMVLRSTGPLWSLMSTEL